MKIETFERNAPSEAPHHALATDVIAPEACAFIRDWAQENLARLGDRNVNPSYDGLTIQQNRIDNPIVSQYLDIITKAALDLVALQFRDVVAETDGVMINKWPTGMELGLHADNAFYPSREPNYTAWRSYSGVFYLNGDFEGGEFYFGDHEHGDTKVIKPVANSLIVFRSGLCSTHGVKRVESGTRWTVPLWFTHDPAQFARNR
jgi:predicted 2-oxoglutarate/Fe(II)-dependent dioxygenase YbiX